MSFCDNSIVLIIFILIKIFIYIVFPIIIIKNKNKEYINYLILTEIILLISIISSNMFSLNKCIYNSNISGLNKSSIKKEILNYNETHYSEDDYEAVEEINPDDKFKTYKGKEFYYFNQNNDFLKNKSFSCNDEMHLNKYGAPIVSTSMAVSTLFDENITPIDILDLYNEESLYCEEDINIGDVFAATANRYTGLDISEISSSSVVSAVQNGGIVIAEINAKADSKLTCGKNYIVIYNISLNNNFIIADPNDINNDYVCPYSSNAFGNTIKSNRTNSEWSFNDINNVTAHYYLLRRI